MSSGNACKLHKIQLSTWTKTF